MKTKRTHNFINSWRPSSKQKDKVQIELRVGRLTIFGLAFDISKGSFRIMILNIGYETKN